MPDQCPASARTVPVQCPLRKHTVPVDSTSPRGRVLRAVNYSKFRRGGHCVFSQRALYGHCTGTGWALYGHWSGTLFPLSGTIERGRSSAMTTMASVGSPTFTRGRSVRAQRQAPRTPPNAPSTRFCTGSARLLRVVTLARACFGPGPTVWPCALRAPCNTPEPTTRAELHGHC